jgi:hypothetical protein
MAIATEPIAVTDALFDLERVLEQTTPTGRSR